MKNKFVLLIVCLGLFLSGCNNVNLANTTDVSHFQGTSVLDKIDSNEVAIVMPGVSNNEACERISGALSQLTMEELGVDVKITQIPIEEYASYIWKHISQKDMADLFFLPEEQPIYLYVYENALAPLSSLLLKSESLFSLYTQKQWQAKQQLRLVYQVPAGTTDIYSTGFFVRTELLNQLSINPQDIKTLDELYEVLCEVKKTWPDVVPIVPNYGQVYSFLGQDPLDDNLGVLMNNQNTTVSNLYKSEEYEEICQKMYQWYMEGLILKNASFRTESATDLLIACNGFGFFGKINNDTLEKYSRAYAGSLTAISLGPLVQDNSGLSGGWCLPVQQSKKTQAMQVLQFLYTNEKANSIFIFGEENIDNTVQTTNKWTNTFVAYKANLALEKQPTNETVLQSKAYGVAFNNSGNLALIDACKAIVQRYNNALLSGYLNPDEALPMFLEELENAGIDEIIKDKQLQLNNWLKVK